MGKWKFNKTLISLSFFSWWNIHRIDGETRRWSFSPSLAVEKDPSSMTGGNNQTWSVVRTVSLEVTVWKTEPFPQNRKRRRGRFVLAVPPSMTFLRWCHPDWYRRGGEEECLDRKHMSAWRKIDNPPSIILIGWTEQDNYASLLTLTGSHVEYANYICWISNTYYVPFESSLPARHDERPKHIGLSTLLSCRWRSSLVFSSLLPMDPIHSPPDVHTFLHSLRSLACSSHEDRLRHCQSRQNSPQYGATESRHPRSNTQIYRQAYRSCSRNPTWNGHRILLPIQTQYPPVLSDLHCRPCSRQLFNVRLSLR